MRRRVLYGPACVLPRGRRGMRRKESFHSFFRAGKKGGGRSLSSLLANKAETHRWIIDFLGRGGREEKWAEKKTQNSILFFSFQGGYERWTLGARKERRKVDPCARVIRPLSTRPSSLPPPRPNDIHWFWGFCSLEWSGRGAIPSSYPLPSSS